MNRYLDWYEQAKIDFEKAKNDLELGYYEWCCFGVYPNSFAEGKPSDYYNKRMAEEAIDAADKIIGFCENYIIK